MIQKPTKKGSMYVSKFINNFAKISLEGIKTKVSSKVGLVVYVVIIISLKVTSINDLFKTLFSTFFVCSSSRDFKFKIRSSEFFAINF